MDIQLFKIVDVFGVQPVSDVIEGGVRTVRLSVRGRVTSIAEVTIDGFLAVSFEAVSSSQVDVVLPSALNKRPLSELDFVVLSGDQTPEAGTYEILFGIGRRSRMISGHNVLVQRFLRFLLMTPGTDRSDPEAGAGLLQLAGSVTPLNIESKRTEVARIHDLAKRQILARQFTGPTRRRLPTETLLDARLAGVGLDDDSRLRVSSVLTDGRGQRITASSRM